MSCSDSLNAPILLEIERIRVQTCLKENGEQLQLLSGETLVVLNVLTGYIKNQILHSLGFCIARECRILMYLPVGP